MEDIIENFENKINADKEILSVLPKNNKKNKKIYMDKLLELKTEYEQIKKDITSEIKRRVRKLAQICENPEIAELEEKVRKFKEVVTIINPYNTSYEKMGLDENLFVLRRFYRNNLEEINYNIEQCIKKFEKVGAEVTPNDFIYSHAVNEYMYIFFEEMKKGDVTSKRIKEAFEEIYWRCSDVIIHIEMNMNYIYYNKKKIIDKYYQNKKEEILKNLKIDENKVFTKYIELRKELMDLKSKDTRIIFDKFLNKNLDIKDFEEKSINNLYSKILAEPVEEYSEEELENIDQSIIKLSRSLSEYSNYLDFQFATDKAEELFNDKKTHRNEYENVLRKIEKEEKKIVNANEKFQKVKKHRESKLFRKRKVAQLEKINLDVNSKVLEIKDLYRRLPYLKVVNSIEKNIDEFSTVYDLMYLMSSFYGYLVEVIMEKFKDIQFEDIVVKVNEIKEFIEFPYITIINNITVGKEKNLTLFIKDKYILSNLKITKEDFEESAYMALVRKVNLLVENYYLNKSKIDLNDIKFELKAKKILDIDE